MSGFPSADKIAQGAISAVPVLGGVADSFINSYTSRKNTQLTIAAQRAEAEKAYQRSVEMWHMQNEYNTPAEQMKRFGAAGLNPHLIYGQGSPGNANSVPEYHAPNLQYRYAAPAYGAAVSSALPTLMAVGSWMQNMRLGEERIRGEQLSNTKVEQMVEFLRSKYPRDIEKLDNLLSLFPYQSSMMQANEQKAWQSWNDLLFEAKHKYGDEMFPGTGHSGMRAIERAKAAADARLRNLQADWYSPDRIMKLVLGGVGALGRAGGSFFKGSRQVGKTAKRVKTFYQNGKRRSQVVDY